MIIYMECTINLFHSKNIGVQVSIDTTVIEKKLKDGTEYTVITE